MKYKTYEFIMLILYWVLYGMAIGVIICNGFKDALELMWFVCLSIFIIARTFSATITLLDKESKK